eukprot:11442009-Alexandrium_andersonii.AAC.1
MISLYGAGGNYGVAHAALLLALSARLATIAFLEISRASFRTAVSAELGYGDGGNGGRNTSRLKQATPSLATSGTEA